MLNSSAHFKIVPFDTRAAIELAQITRVAIDSGDKKAGSSSSWAKVKFDRQIVAIARTEGAQTIYSDDEDIVRCARKLGIEVIGICELSLPPDSLQRELFAGGAGP